MARKKTADDGGKPKLKNAVVIRATEAWAEWLNSYAGHMGIPATVLLDLAVREKAKRDGYTAPPSRTQEEKGPKP